MSTNEEWRDVVGYEGRYKISSLGRVQSLPNPKDRPRLMPKFLKLVCSVKPGYPCVSLGCIDGAARRKWIHDLVAEAFIGPKPAMREVNHKNGIKTDNRVENLEYVTKRQNLEHAIKLGLVAHGERVTLARLTASQVIEIRRLYDQREVTMAQLAEQFNVGEHAIRKAIRGITWRRLPLGKMATYYGKPTPSRDAALSAEKGDR